jgi:1-acyl-sn-glycerol-3-phosphate acyltransferase
LKQLLKQGRDRLAQQVPVLIFPQGTRIKVGETGRFNKGGAMLAVDSQVPVVPIVHNAGLYWPGKSFVKFPGTVQVRIGKPLATVERTVDEVHRDTVAWIEHEMREIGA